MNRFHIQHPDRPDTWQTRVSQDRGTIVIEIERQDRGRRIPTAFLSPTVSDDELITKYVAAVDEAVELMIEEAQVLARISNARQARKQRRQDRRFVTAQPITTL